MKSVQINFFYLSYKMSVKNLETFFLLYLHTDAREKLQINEYTYQ